MKIITKEKCFFCGSIVSFAIREGATLFREAACSQCGASLRSADIAAVLVQVITGKKEDKILKDCVKDYPTLKILNMFSEGPIHRSLKEFDGYEFGEFFDGVKSGEFFNGVKCIDLHNIPFKSNNFDIVITEDVLEHVNDIDLVFKEIYRVLKPDGVHVFTVPIHEKNKTVSRKENKNLIYHGDPLRQKGALVITDFGNDIPQLLAKYEMDTQEFVCHSFFAADEISYIDEEYAYYLAHQDDLAIVFRYNSIVYVARKKKLFVHGHGVGNSLWRKFLTCVKLILIYY